MLRCLRLLIAIAVALAFTACDHAKEVSEVSAQTPAAAPTEESRSTKISLPPDSGPPPAFDSHRAMQYVKEIVAFGPRPIGSANHKKVETYLHAHLKGDEVETTYSPPIRLRGNFPFTM